MRILAMGLLGVLIASSSVAQKSPIKFGEIPLEDLQMKVYSPDSSAAAVILTDFGESAMNYAQEKGFRLTFERIVRIKILTKDGLHWGDYVIPLFHRNSSEETIISLKAVTYNLENGKIVESDLDKAGIYKEKYNDDFNLVKFTLPNVKEGSVLEVAYKLVSDFIFNFQDWEFQHKIPVRWSEYRARIPEYYNYEKYMQGYIPPTINETSFSNNSFLLTYREDPDDVSSPKKTQRIEFRENRFRWAVKDVPAFKEEPHMTTYKDYISKIVFELSFTKFPNRPIDTYMGSWEDINKMYYERDDFAGQVTGNGYLKKTVEEITAGASSPEDMIRLTHQYVRDNFQWDSLTRIFVDGSIRKVTDEKKGSTSEINLLLGAMLEKRGIEVYPVLISTRDHGFIRETTPVSSQFNSTICLAKVGDKEFLLDATDKFLPMGTLPERCLNGKGLVISKKNGYSWVDLKAPSKSKSTVTIDVTLKEEGDFSGTLMEDCTGYFAAQNRKRFSKGEAGYVKKVSSQHIEISKSSFENVTQLGSSFKETHDLNIKEQAILTGDMVYFNPIFVSRMDANPFKLEKREYPVDFGSPFDKTHVIKVIIPSGYKVEELPKSMALGLPNNMAKFFYNVIQLGNTIQITSSLQINRSLYVQDEYAALRELYTQAVAKQAEQIVLKKL